MDEKCGVDFGGPGGAGIWLCTEPKGHLGQHRNPAVSAINLHPPVLPFHVTRAFSATPKPNPLDGGKSQLVHLGVDLRAPVGTRVFAADDGVVSGSYLSTVGPIDPKTGRPKWYAYGERVTIAHHGCCTCYNHLSKRLVRQGDVVERGQLVGYSGATGSCAGAHLDFELRIGGRPADPVAFIVMPAEAPDPKA